MNPEQLLFIFGKTMFVQLEALGEVLQLGLPQFYKLLDRHSL
jgi:hypothetical protein